MINKEKPLKIVGKPHFIVDNKKKPIHNIDTDMIFHNSFLHITEISKMGVHALGNLSGWENFPNMVSQGDIIIAGENFGAGSSRQQAVDCFISLGIILIIAESFGAIYKRNAINSGIPIIEAPGLFNKLSKSLPSKIEVDLQTGKLFFPPKINFQFKPMSKIQTEIYYAGNLLEYGKQQKPQKN